MTTTIRTSVKKLINGYLWFVLVLIVLYFGIFAVLAIHKIQPKIVPATGSTALFLLAFGSFCMGYARDIVDTSVKSAIHRRSGYIFTAAVLFGTATLLAFLLTLTDGAKVIGLWQKITFYSQVTMFVTIGALSFVGIVLGICNIYFVVHYACNHHRTAYKLEQSVSTLERWIKDWTRGI